MAVPGEQLVATARPSRAPRRVGHKEAVQPVDARLCCRSAPRHAGPTSTRRWRRARTRSPPRMCESSVRSWRAIRPATAVESMPPLRKAPMGTSATWRATAVSSSPRMRTTASSYGAATAARAALVLASRSQYGSASSAPCHQRSIWPVGAATPCTMAAGGGTRPRER